MHKLKTCDDLHSRLIRALGTAVERRLNQLKGHCHEVRMRKFCSRKALPELSAAIMEVSGNILFCI